MKHDTPERIAKRETLRRALELAFDEALAAVKNPFRVDPMGNTSVDPAWYAGELAHLLNASVDRTPEQLSQLGSEVGFSGMKTAVVRYALQGMADPLHAMMSLVVGQAFSAVGRRWGLQ